jgi:hypothetical protein
LSSERRDPKGHPRYVEEIRRAPRPPVTATVAAPASAAGGSATHNGFTLTASNATGLAAAGETATVTGSGFSALNGYYVALCAVPENYSYGTKPSPCAGGDGQGGTGVGPSSWVTNLSAVGAARH